MDAKTLLSRTLVVLVVMDAVAMSAAVALHPSVWQEGDRAVVVVSGAALAAYLAVALALRAPGGTAAIEASRAALRWGVAGGIVSTVHLPIENFVTLPASLRRPVDILLFLALFGSFGAAAGVAARRTGDLKLSAGAGIGSAMVAIGITIVTGFLTNFAFVDQQEKMLRGAFAQSRMTDPVAFTFSNSFDAAATHLVEGPIIGLVVGGLVAFVMLSLMRPR